MATQITISVTAASDDFTNLIALAEVAKILKDTHEKLIATKLPVTVEIKQATVRGAKAEADAGIPADPLSSDPPADKPPPPEVIADRIDAFLARRAAL